MEGIDQRINGGQAGFFGDISKVGVTGGCRRAGMAEQRLDMTEAQAAFKQMGSKAVPKGVNGYFFLMPYSATTIFMAFWAPPLSIWVVAC